MLTIRVRIPPYYVIFNQKLSDTHGSYTLSGYINRGV